MPFVKRSKLSLGEIIMTIPPRSGKFINASSDLEDCVSHWVKLTQAISASKFSPAGEGLSALTQIDERLSESIDRMMVCIVLMSRTLCLSDDHVQVRTALRFEVADMEANFRLVSPCLLTHVMD
jgi:hypothetical protein